MELNSLSQNDIISAFIGMSISSWILDSSIELFLSESFVINFLYLEWYYKVEEIGEIEVTEEEVLLPLLRME